MKILNLTLLSLYLLPGQTLWAEPSSVVSPVAATDPLVEALPILQAKYVDFPSLNYKPGDHLSDLIDRSNGKISLGAPEAPPIASPIITVALPDGIVYWRLASFSLPTGKGWPDLVSDLKQSSVRGIVLDLRSNLTPGDYQGASNLRSFFGPPDASMAPSSELMPEKAPIAQLFPFPRIVLTNHGTTGAAEALAGFLQADGALVIGQPTAGKVAVFQEDKLSSGQVLRYAVAAMLPGDLTAFKFRSEAPAWGHPVVPDIALNVDDHTEKAALALIRANHILDVIQESAERHRMSEASLVQGQDPEWDDYLTSLEGRPVLLSLPVIHDVVLISALDSLKAIRFSQEPAPAQTTTTASLPASSSVQ
jgi:hypothetical protein